VPREYLKEFRIYWMENGIHFEVDHRKKDGTVFPVEVSAGLLELGGKKHILAFNRDITEVTYCRGSSADRAAEGCGRPCSRTDP